MPSEFKSSLPEDFSSPDLPNEQTVSTENESCQFAANTIATTGTDLDIACEVEIGESNEKENSPPKKKSKKGQGQPEEWLRSRNKRRRMKGKSYQGVRLTEEGYKQDVEIEPRYMGLPCDSDYCYKSKYRHCDLFDEVTRQNIFDKFWSDMDWNQRKVYVASLVDIKKTKAPQAEDSKKKNSMYYHLKLNQEKKQVCKNLFLSTLGLGEWSVLAWLKESQYGIVETSHEKKTPRRKQRKHTEGREKVGEFLDTLPRVPSHYCRSQSSRNYLEPIYDSHNHLYRIYCEFCENQQCIPVSRQVFFEIFQQINMALFHPKKDECNICASYKAGNLVEAEYVEHTLQKEAAREEKRKDKETASNETKVLCLDLQKVLLAPYLYYKMKLAVHNFTLYDMKSGNVHCYIWHEGQGDLSANIFASIIYSYLQGNQSFKKNIMYSDRCGYQNRNATLANALLDFLIYSGITVVQKFLVCGHTQMEVDSVHSTIEKKVRNKQIYVPANYVDLIFQARPGQPYAVQYLSYNFFKDFSKVQYYTSIRPGNKVNDPKVNELRALQYTPEGTVFFKLNFEDQWAPLPRNSKATNQGKDESNHEIPALLEGPIKITAAKYQNLQDLKRVILPDYHEFYDNLPHE